MTSVRTRSISRRTLLAGAFASGLTVLPSAPTHAENVPFPLVVDLDWLAVAAGERHFQIVDVSPLHIWRREHIGSALHAWWRDTVDPNYPVFGAVLTQGDDQIHRQRVVDSLHLTSASNVVVYDNANGFRAARLVWFLRFLGFDQIALLNAHADDWKRAPFPIETAPSSGEPISVNPQSGFYLVTEQVVARLAQADIQLVDIRTDGERLDDLDGQMPLGQIPQSIRLPWTTLLDETGHLLSAGQLSAQTTAAQLDPIRPVVLYGRFGVDTALSWLALSVAGFTDVQTYDRGWAEWSTTPDLPREPLS